MVIQASHLERSIEEVCRWIGMGFTRPEHHKTKRVSDKIKWCKNKIKELGNTKLETLNNRYLIIGTRIIGTRDLLL